MNTPHHIRRVHPRSKTRGLKELIIQNCKWVPLILAFIWAGLPLFWALMSSFKTSDEYYIIPPTIWPDAPTIDAYARVLFETDFLRYTWNSTVLAIISTILALALSIFAAYGFARYAFKWRHILLLFVLIPCLVPRVSLIIPLYDLIQAAGFIDTQIALIIVYPASAVPLTTWVLIGFVAAIPREIEEAARMDGAGTLSIVRRFIIPLTIPGLLTVTVLALRDAWNEFPFVLALTSSDAIRTLPYQLFLLDNTFGLSDQGLKQAFALLSILPILFIYLRLEKYVVQGLTQGAVK